MKIKEWVHREAEFRQKCTGRNGTLIGAYTGKLTDMLQIQCNTRKNITLKRFRDAVASRALGTPFKCFTCIALTRKNTYKFPAVLAYIEEFIKVSSLPAPTDTETYDNLVSVMKRYHRSELSTNGVLLGNLLDSLNPKGRASIKEKTTHGFSKYQVHAEALGVKVSKVNTEIPDVEFSQGDALRVSCHTCEFSEVITAISFNRRKFGCKMCTNQASWKFREVEFLGICASKKVTLLSEYTGIREERVLLECTECKTSFTRKFTTVTGEKYPVECPTCHPPRIHGKLGVTRVYKGIIFDSGIELDTYKLLEDMFTKILTHVPYAALTSNSKIKYISDFVLEDKYVLEVSSFNIKHHPKYHSIIEEKKRLLQNTKYTFVFCNSLAEVKSFLKTTII